MKILMTWGSIHHHKPSLQDMEEQDRIVGELLQPGGIRSLEGLGLDDCAKEGIDSIVVSRPIIDQGSGFV